MNNQNDRVEWSGLLRVRLRVERILSNGRAGHVYRIHTIIDDEEKNELLFFFLPRSTTVRKVKSLVQLRAVHVDDIDVLRSRAHDRKHPKKLKVIYQTRYVH